MEELTDITIFYYCHENLDLRAFQGCFTRLDDGRTLIPEEFKTKKDIIAVCDGHIEVLEQD